MPTDMFLGTWTLIPELSIYEAGAKPASGLYRIIADGETISFEVSWTTEESDKELSASFSGPSDGTKQKLPVAKVTPKGAPDSFNITRIDEYTLDSTAFCKGKAVSVARRQASHDGSLLAVLQEYLLPGGKTCRNFQVYKKS